jgi:hypothetical protein
MMWLLVGLALGGPPCPDEPVAQVESAAAAVQEAYETFDEAGLNRASKALDAAIVCLQEVVSPTTLAHIHQASSLAAFVAGRTRAARLSMVSARLTDPAWKLDDQYFVAEHPYRKLWDEATDPGPVQVIGDISPKAWVVDSFERAEAPIARAFLLQVKGPEGIEQSIYLWNFDEIPNLGQHDEVSRSAPMRTLAVEGGLLGRFVASSQTVEIDEGWRGHAESSGGAGVSARVRYTPMSNVGAEFSATIAGPDDAVVGGGLAPEMHLVGLFGGAFGAGESGQAFVNTRVGLARDKFRAWTLAGTDERANLYSVVALSAGLEGGFRTEQLGFGLAVDYLLAGATVPYELRVSSSVTHSPWGPLGLYISPAFRRGGLAFEDNRGNPAGARSDVELRLVAGAALWL